jgi:type VI secretion system FHA domain protein
LATESNAELAAFLAGLGIGDPADIHDSEAMLRLSGQLLRAMTEGLMAVMMARASFKSELRLEVTTIRSQDNNPFQFCVDPDDALERLLWRRSRGFLDPAAAVSKTFDDIQAHQMAMIAGLRAAMRAMLARFQPEELEKHFERQSHLDKLLPMARKSKCWDLFVSTFDQVASDASEDFMRLFGDAFNRAYDDQVQRLMAAKHVGSS